MTDRRVFKRAFFCGTLWCLGSIQYLVCPDRWAWLFLVSFLLGVMECIFSVHFQKNSGILKGILAAQAAYYLFAFLYLLVCIQKPVLKWFGGLQSVGMLMLIYSAIQSLNKCCKARMKETEE